jgi:hypothetical protein
VSAVNQTSDSTFRSGSHLRPNADVVVQQMGDQTVLLHLRTNHFYQLNSTAARLWELLSAGYSLERIREQMLQEFDVDEIQLGHELQMILAALQKEDLVKVYE